jgi:hypothetical protein
MFSVFWFKDHLFDMGKVSQSCPKTIVESATICILGLSIEDSRVNSPQSSKIEITRLTFFNGQAWSTFESSLGFSFGRARGRAGMPIPPDHDRIREAFAVGTSRNVLPSF